MSFKYKVKLLRHTFAYGASGRRIARKATIVVLSKDLTHFWWSLEIELINYKVELKLNWAEHSILSAIINDNINANSNNIIFLSKS